MEFSKFLELPKLVKVSMAIAVDGKNVPKNLILDYGWSIRIGNQVTKTFDSFRDYLSSCRGEFSVCKNVFVACNTGWFSDKSAAFLASGKPVVLQDTGFSMHLPVGEGLFAVNTVEEAAEAINKIEKDYTFHSCKAREIACEFLEAKVVMKKFLDEVGI